MGFKRKNGRYGVRNHVLVLSSVSCANGVVEAIGRALPDVIPVTHAYGCGFGPKDITPFLKTLTGLINNPNIGAALIVGLGCEILNPDFLSIQSLTNPSINWSYRKTAAVPPPLKRALRFAGCFWIN